MQRAAQFSNSTIFLKWIELENEKGSDYWDRYINDPCPFCGKIECIGNCEQAVMEYKKVGLRIKSTLEYRQNN